MTRRALFGILASAAAGALADPDRLLWRPKLISIPRDVRTHGTATPDICAPYLEIIGGPLGGQRFPLKQISFGNYTLNANDYLTMTMAEY